MTKEQASAVLNGIFNTPYEDANLQLCLASIQDEDEPPALQKVQMSQEVANEMRLSGSRKIRHYRKKFQAGDLRVLAYDPAAMNRDDEIEFLVIGEIDDVASQVNPISNIAALEPFTASDEFIDGLKFYTLVYTIGENTFYSMRSFTKARELGRSSVLGLRFSDAIFNKLKEPTFLFDSNIDCLSANGVLFILNKNNFQQMFHYFEKVIAAGKAALKTVSERISIKNFDSFSRLCTGNLNMMAKLKNLASKEYLDSLSMDDIKRVIHSFNLPATIVEEDGQEKLLFDPQSKDKWLLLRILDDDYLGSEMTKLKYEANSKRAVSDGA